MPGSQYSGAKLGSTKLDGASFIGADPRDIPWLYIMELTLTPGVTIRDIQYEQIKNLAIE